MAARRGPLYKHSQGYYPVSEKDEVRAGDKLMDTLGFSRWSYSQPRKTMQTPGIPDRFYTHRAKGLAVFWEAKRGPGQAGRPKGGRPGKQSEAQREFERDVTAAGIEYVCGTSDMLTEWARNKGLIL